MQLEPFRTTCSDQHFVNLQVFARRFRLQIADPSRAHVVAEPYILQALTPSNTTADGGGDLQSSWSDKRQSGRLFRAPEDAWIEPVAQRRFSLSAVPICLT